MAISFIGSRIAANDNASANIATNSHTNAAGGLVVVGDLLVDDVVVVAIARGSSGASTPTAPTSGANLSSFSAIGSVAFGNDSDDINLHLFAAKYDTIPAGSGTTIATIPASGSASNGQLYASYILRGVDYANLIALTGGALRTNATGINSALANAPSETPTVAGSWIIVAGSGGYNAAFSANYSAPGDLSSTTNHWRTLRAESLTQKAMLGVGLKADWASGAFDPAAFAGPATNARQSWAASTLVVPPSGSSTQSLTPSLFTNSNTHFAPTITTGAVTLAPSLFTNTQTFHAPNVAHVIAPDLFANAQTFHGPTVAPGAVTLAPPVLSNGQLFYSPSVVGGAVDIAPTLFDNTVGPTPPGGTRQIIFAPTVALASANLTPSLVTNSSTFYGPTVTTGAVDLAPPLFTNSQSFHAPTVSATYALTPGLLTNTQTFHAATLAATYGILVPLVENEQTFHGPTVATDGETLSPPLVTNSQSFHSPTITTGAVALLPALFSNSGEIYAPLVRRFGWTPVADPNGAWAPGEDVAGAWVEASPPNGAWAPEQTASGMFDSAVFDEAIFDAAGGRWTPVTRPDEGSWS